MNHSDAIPEAAWIVRRRLAGIRPFRRMADYKAALKNPPYLADRAIA